MDELNEDMLMGLPEFRKLFHLSPSGERRMRRNEQDWPPHIVVGRKVFYFRDGVRDFLARQQDAQPAGRPVSGTPSGADGLSQQVPAFNSEQVAWLTGLMTGTAQGEAERRDRRGLRRDVGPQAARGH